MRYDLLAGRLCAGRFTALGPLLAADGRQGARPNLKRRPPSIRQIDTVCDPGPNMHPDTRLDGRPQHRPPALLPNAESSLHEARATCIGSTTRCRHGRRGTEPAGRSGTFSGRGATQVDTPYYYKGIASWRLFKAGARASPVVLCHGIRARGHHAGPHQPYMIQLRPRAASHWGGHRTRARG